MSAPLGWLNIVEAWLDENGIPHEELLVRLGVAGELHDPTQTTNPQLEQVRALAFSARWADTVGTGHLLAARILNVLDGGR